MTRASAACLFAALLAAAPALRAGAEAPLPVDLELVLAVDISGSIDEEEMKMQRDGYVAALVDPLVLKAVTGGVLGRIAVAYVEWASYHDRRLTVDWMLVRDAGTARAFAGEIARAPVRGGMSTSISGAIEFVLPMFGRNGYDGTRRVIDISGDGPNNEGPLVTVARDRAAALGVAINGLPIVNDRPNRMGFPNLEDLDKYYEGCVIAGEGSFIVVAGNFQAFGEAIRRKLILEIAGLSPAESPRRADANPSAPTPKGPPGFAGGRAGAKLPAPLAFRAPVPVPRLVRAAGAAYEPGCDIGERQRTDFFSRRGWNP